VIVGVIRRKPVLTHASIVCEGMLASVNSVKFGEFREFFCMFLGKISMQLMDLHFCDPLI